MKFRHLFFVLLVMGFQFSSIANEFPKLALPNLNSLQEFDSATRASNSDVRLLHLLENKHGYFGLYAVGKNIFVCFYGKSAESILKKASWEKWLVVDSDGKEIFLGAARNLYEPNLMVETTVIANDGSSAVYPYYFGSRISVENLVQKEFTLLLPALELAFEISLENMKVLKMYNIEKK